MFMTTCLGYENKGEGGKAAGHVDAGVTCNSEGQRSQDGDRAIQ